MNRPLLVGQETCGRMVSASPLQGTATVRSLPKFRPPHLHHRLSLFRWNPHLLSSQLRFPIRRPRFALQCCASAPPSASDDVKESPLDTALRFVMEALERFKKPAAAVVLLGFLLAAQSRSAALAASGGRMGGTAFSSSSSRSNSSSSFWSYSDTAGSSFSHSEPYYAPYYGPSPLGGALYVGPAFGAGLGVRPGFFFLTMGFVGVVLLSGLLSDRSDNGSFASVSQNTNIIKLQVGLLGTARSLQKDLDRIAESADTSTSEGLNYILRETTLTLLRCQDSCISAYSYVKANHSVEDGEKHFKQLSIEERSKFDDETLVNVNNIRRKTTRNPTSKSSSNEYIVVTILVASDGLLKLPSINGSDELKEALHMLGSIPSNKTLAVEVLWTPQSDDTLSDLELIEDYPLLRPL